MSELNVSSLLQWQPDGRRLLALVSFPHAEDPDDDAARSAPTGNQPLALQAGWNGVYSRTEPICSAWTHKAARAASLTAGDYDVRSGAWSPDGRTLAMHEHLLVAFVIA